MKPGIYQIPAADYHADPCPAPSLSRSIALALVRQSPMHARYIHPKLGSASPSSTQAMDEGSALHALMLGQGDQIRTVDVRYDAKHDRAGEFVTDYRTKAATEARNAILADGCIPVLSRAYDMILDVHGAILTRLSAHDEGEGFIAPGKSEAAAIACVDGVWLRCMVDRLPDDKRLPPYDLKLTRMSAAPKSWERRVITEYAFQCAFYRRVLAAVEGRQRPAMRFIAAEAEPPHGVSILAAAPSLMAIAEAEVEAAIALWKRCLEADDWPGYPAVTAHVEAPAWAVNQWVDRQFNDEQMQGIAA